MNTEFERAYLATSTPYHIFIHFFLNAISLRQKIIRNAVLFQGLLANRHKQGNSVENNRQEGKKHFSALAPLCLCVLGYEFSLI